MTKIKNNKKQKVKDQSQNNIQTILPSYLQIKKDSLCIKISAKPNANESKIESNNDEIIISVESEPKNGAANTEIEKILAKKLGIEKKYISIDKGATSKDKLVKIHNDSGINSQEIIDKLL